MIGLTFESFLNNSLSQLNLSNYCSKQGFFDIIIPLQEAGVEASKDKLFIKSESFLTTTCKSPMEEVILSSFCDSPHNVPSFQQPLFITKHDCFISEVWWSTQLSHIILSITNHFVILFLEHQGILHLFFFLYGLDLEYYPILYCASLGEQVVVVELFGFRSQRQWWQQVDYIDYIIIISESELDSMLI